jgi:predicted phosphohydrolase
MNTPGFTTTLLVDQTAEAVFNAINNVRGWWSEEIEGGTEKLNDVFDYHYEDVHYEDLHRCKMKLVEVLPAKRVAWLVLENYFKFTKDKSEWTGTKIIFDIDKQGNKTAVRFTHLGLVPEYECYDICKAAWTNYIQNSLRSLIETGKGKPNGKGKPQTENEKKLASGN